MPACFFGSNELQSNNEATSTGHCAVIVSKGERSFMTHLGTIRDFEGDHILTEISRKFTRVELENLLIGAGFKIEKHYEAEEMKFSLVLASGDQAA